MRPIGRLKRAALTAVSMLVAVVLAAPGAAAATPLQTRAVWVGQTPLETTPQELAAEAKAAGVRTLFLKAAEGTTPEPGFTATLLAALRAEDISVCAWTFVYGLRPEAEAAAALAATQAGAPCLIVDAEGQYDKRYAAAQLYVHTLRKQLGPAFPIALAGQAEITEHPTFPYSVFLGPGAFNVNMPQVYWRELRLSVGTAIRLSFGENGWYGRPVAPVGQLFDGASSGELSLFAREATIDGAPGFSLYDLAAAPPASIQAALSAPVPAPRRRVALMTVRPGADGDDVLWAQEHLDGAGAHLPVGGFYGAQTAAAVASFQRRKHLPVTGLLDSRTWRALLHVRPRIPSWASGPPESAR